MSGCVVCGDSSLSRSCNYCGQTVCTEHRLPESHDCPNANQATPPRTRQQPTTTEKLKRYIPSLGTITLLIAVVIVAGGTIQVMDDDSNRSSEWDAEAVEAAAIERINDARQQNGLEPLSHSADIERRAEQWSERMASRGDLTHGSGKCSFSGENIALSYWKERIESGDDTLYYDTPKELGRGLARQWLNSKPHRENIMRPGFAATGVGVVKTEDEAGKTAVYATQRFCG